MIRLDQEIEAALETENLAAAAKAQRELRQLQFDRPSATCQHLIAEECRRATCLLRQGDAVSTQERIQAAKKLGRWLRWQRFASRGLVPPHTVLGGLLCALRSQPEVAWTAQCALFHAARVAVVPNRSVKEGPRGIITNFLLNEPTPFPLCMPDLASRSLHDFQKALATTAVRSFFGQLRALTLIDPGYGDDPDREHLYEHLPFARVFGRNFKKVETLEMLGFEDVGISLFLPSIAMPELKCLRIVGALQTPMAQEALVLLLHRHGPKLTELVLNVWTEFLCDADDPLVVCDRMPRVKRLTVRAPPPVPWEHFAATFPNLEEVTFLYDQDFALNSVSLVEEYGDPHPDELSEHTSLLYRDAVIFARDIHQRGLRKLETQCGRLKVVQLAVGDTSFGYDVTPMEKRFLLAWRREVDDAKHSRRFCRDDVRNNQTRRVLGDQSEPPNGWRSVDDMDSDCGPAHYGQPLREVSEQEAAAAGAAVMLQVVRLFDDPSLERSLRFS